jgi:hypothetical protein
MPSRAILPADMAKVQIFIDEGGDMTFAHPPRGSRYFIIGSVTMENCAVGNELLDLRRELAWQGFNQPGFHATFDKPHIREQVYALLETSEFRADVTVIEKPKTQDHLRADPTAFYKQAWFFHFQDLAPDAVKEHDELLVVASALQVNRKKQAIHTAVYDVVQQLSPTLNFRTVFWPAVTDPCLQVVDYVVWAVQRKYEKGDSRAYDRISSKVVGERLPFRNGQRFYY